MKKIFFKAAAKKGKVDTSFRDLIFLKLLEEEGLPRPCKEYEFKTGRKWAFDFAWPDIRLAVEIEGGIFTKQAHGSISGALRDIEKYNAAVLLGWRVFRILPDQTQKVEIINKIKEAYNTNFDIYWHCFNSHCLIEAVTESSKLISNNKSKKLKLETSY